MKLVLLRRGNARQYVARWHRHNAPPPGDVFSIGAEVDGWIVGVAMIGRPVARMADDGETLEVTRVATDGTRNACSFLYGAAVRLVRGIRYKRLITYTRADEPGASLRAVGARPDALRGISAGASGWTSRPGRVVDSAASVRWTLFDDRTQIPAECGQE